MPSPLLRPLLLALVLPLLLLLLLGASTGDAKPFQLDPKYHAYAEAIIKHTTQSIEFDTFTHLCDYYGPRYRGTPALNNAIRFIEGKMIEEGLDTTLEPVENITNWVRGKESVTLLEPRVTELAMLGLGTSVGGDVTAPVVVFSSFDDMLNHTDIIPGKIVLFNVPFTSYGRTVGYRTRGASRAAEFGAVGCLVRSIASFSLYTPHTGVMGYDPEQPKIPSAAITVEDAAMLGRMYERGTPIKVRLQMGCKTIEPASSFNLLGQVNGTLTPNEVVVLGGHSDSWDVGQGAIDDGGGLFTSWQAVNTIQQLVQAGVIPAPRRSIRAVLWVDEEISQRGASTYFNDHKSELGDTVIAMESDTGNFHPTGFGFSGLPEAHSVISEIVGSLLYDIGAGNVTKGGEDVDNGPLCEAGVPCSTLESTGFSGDHYYFFFHHSNADMVDHINEEGFRNSVAAFAVLSYVLADMEERLPSQLVPGSELVFHDHHAMEQKPDPRRW